MNAHHWGGNHTHKQQDWTTRLLSYLLVNLDQRQHMGRWNDPVELFRENKKEVKDV